MGVDLLVDDGVEGKREDYLRNEHHENVKGVGPHLSLVLGHIKTLTIQVASFYEKAQFWDISQEEASKSSHMGQHHAVVWQLYTIFLNNAIDSQHGVHQESQGHDSVQDDQQNEEIAGIK